ncbi:HupE/UreJ family protein [Endozoicomonas arenosclerae]|uniref:HupE/UreJ family protein n=1 Tax=Endozoicomonas arenosclerae TaxID=1633495 RepID=UPI0009A1DE58|nr:HupE/UreJ family protein [Endozoicomonas arenosclerae]
MKHCLLFFSLLLMLIGKAIAHPMAPGLWAMNEQSPGHFLVIWKTSLKPMPGIQLTPMLPEGCVSNSELAGRKEGTGQVVQWTTNCSSISVIGSEFKVDGLDGSPSGVLFRLKTLEGNSYHQMLTSDDPAITLSAAPSAMDIMWTYVVSGFDHLLSGLDHVFFVIMLTLLVGWGRQLVWTITLFTLGHSVTLSLTALGYVNFPVMLVEAIIALSIVVAAAEVIRNDSNSLFRRRPWLMSGGFGLLHGMGFAGVLSEFGLPANDIPLALAAFNIGIEIGQLLVIAVFIVIWKGILKIKSNWSSLSQQMARLTPAYTIGAVAALWFWQRIGIEPLLAS